MKAPPRLMNDRISQLPQPILRSILDCLSLREAARTCRLSKTWRYLGSTGSYFTMIEDLFKGSYREFIDANDRNLHIYHDHKICPHVIYVDMSTPGAESFLFLDKWIPVLVRDWAVPDFSLYLYFDRHEENARFDPPSVIFESKSLQRLALRYCNLSRDDILHSDMSSLIHLKELCLRNVCITDEILEKIICSCPLIKLELSRCVGLRAIRIDKRARYLKRFEWSGSYIVNEPSPSLEIDVPSLEKIKIKDYSNWHNDKMTYFLHLKSLSLSSVRLSTKSFDFFLLDFPCLESLSLKDCYGFEEFELSSRSIKKFGLSSRRYVSLNRVVIDVPSIVMFKHEGCAPESFFFTTTSEKWKSDITLGHDRLFDEASQGWAKLVNCSRQ